MSRIKVKFLSRCFVLVAVRIRTPSPPFRHPHISLTSRSHLAHIPHYAIQSHGHSTLPSTLHTSISTYLKLNNEPQVPDALPLHIRQVQWRIQRSPSYRCFDKQFRMLSVKCEKGGCAVAFLLCSDVRVEAKSCYARYWGIGCGAWCGL